MRPLRSIAVLLLLTAGLVSAGFAAPSGAGPQRFFSGAVADAQPSTAPGFLLAGGGGDVDAAWQWFLRRAGGGDVLILRASGGDGYHAYLMEEIGPSIGGLNSVETLVFSDRAAAGAPSVLAAVARAEAVFLAGGDQHRYEQYWLGTPLAAALENHVRQGRPIGGTSAGLAVLGQHVFTAAFPPSAGELTSALALRDPFDGRVTLRSDFFAFAPLQGVITDSHFAERDRFGRLAVFLARLAASGVSPAPLGVGIDERTALLLDGAGGARVVGGGQVHLLAASEPPAMITAGHPLSWSGLWHVRLAPGTNLVWPPVADGLPEATLVDIVEGHWVPRPLPPLPSPLP